MDPRRHFEGEPDLKELREASSIRAADPQAALARLSALADRGSKMAMLYVAEMYGRGIGIAVDPAQEEAWYQRAANANSVFAYFALSVINGNRREYSKAADAARAGANLDYAPCIYRLAIFHQFGVGAPKDLREAKNLLERAAGQGHIYARVRLGGILIRGQFGFLQRFRGVWLIISGVIGGLAIARREPADERLYGHQRKSEARRVSAIPDPARARHSGGR